MVRYVLEFTIRAEIRTEQCRLESFHSDSLTYDVRVYSSLLCFHWPRLYEYECLHRVTHPQGYHNRISLAVVVVELISEANIYLRRSLSAISLKSQNGLAKNMCRVE